MFDFIKADPSSIDNLLKEAKGQYKYVIIDCAPRLELVIKKVINAADLVLAPIAVGAVEQWALEDFIVGVKARQAQFGKPELRVFLSNVNQSWKRLTRMMEAKLSELELTQLETIHMREAVCHATGLGKCTIQMDDSLAIQEIETLTTQVMEIVNG